MKPYYEQDGITLFHGDCRDVWSALHPAAHVLITDPPYQSLNREVACGTTTRLVGPRGPDCQQDGGWFATLADSDIATAMEHFITGLPPSGAAYLFADVKTGLSMFPAFGPSNVIVWDKMKLGMGYSWRRMHEWIAFRPLAEHKLRQPRFGDIIRCPGVSEKKHPTEKPIGVMTPLILNSTDPGDTVIDPFCGIGAVLLAAKLTGRRAVGIEIDERYCEIAATRLAQGVLFGVGTLQCPAFKLQPLDLFPEYALQNERPSV